MISMPHQFYCKQPSAHTATAVLLLLRNDQRLFFAGFTLGVLDVFESFPPVRGGGSSGWCEGRLDSSNVVGSAVTVAIVGTFSWGPKVEPKFLTSAETSELIVSSSENRVYLDVLLLFCAVVCVVATPIGPFAWASKPLDSPLSSTTGLGIGTGTGAGPLLLNDVLFGPGTMVIELVVEDADEDASELAMPEVYGMAGRAGTGGIPAAAKEALLLFRLLPYRGEAVGPLPWFKSEIRRLWLG